MKQFFLKLRRYSMGKIFNVILSALFFCLIVSIGSAQDANENQEEEISVVAVDPSGKLEYDLNTGVITAEKGVKIIYKDSIVTARMVKVEDTTDTVYAEGDVTAYFQGQIWRGEKVIWKYREMKFEAENVRAGSPPFFVGGTKVEGDLSNKVYTVSNAYVTTDNYAKPSQKVKAKKLKIVPNKYFETHDAVLYVGETPVMYFPYYRRRLGRHLNYFTHVPGYRGRYGAYLLNSYNFHLSDEVGGELKLDYRTRRGVGTGLDLDLDLGKYGETQLGYYYLNDNHPEIDSIGYIPDKDRQRFTIFHRTTLSSNTVAKIVGRYQSDRQLLRDFFEHEYRNNTQPSSYFELNHQWQNFGLDAIAQPRINNFFETVERLPDIKLTGYRQQLGESPFYYESESSAGWFRRKFANNSQPDYAAWRGDTFHQILLPQTYYGWLNITPRAGGRFTAYSEATGNGATTKSQTRTVFNTGVEVSTKASRLWQNVTNDFFELDGLRHIIQPIINYVYVPSPSTKYFELPQFDYETMSYRLLPIDYPDYNAIDSIDSQNVIRFSLWNKLQTKRKGEVENFFEWGIFTDWRLNPNPNQSTFADLYSQFDFKPKSWISLGQDSRFDINNGHLKELNHKLTLTPNDTWSFTIGNRYLREDPILGKDYGQNIFYTVFYYKLNENWGFRMSHHFEARDGRMEEQQYSIYRDLRSWTAALTVRLRSERVLPDDFTIAVTLSLKASPRYKVGQDSELPSSLLGG
jgi:hypothetical protein